MQRRSLLAAPLGLAFAAPAVGQTEWPTRPVRLVINTTPGGAVDTVGRLVARHLQEATGQPIVPENRAGASGTIAGQAVLQAPADGTVLLFGASIHALARAVVRQPPYDPLADFIPVARVAHGPLLVVAAMGVEATDLASLARAVRAAPDRFSFATSSLGSAGHIAVLALMRAIGVEVPIVPYRGSAGALADLAGGRVQVMVDPILSALPLVRGGQIKALATTGTSRSAIAPEVPTAAEAGMAELTIATWYGVWARRAVPGAMAQQMNARFQTATRDPALADRLTQLGFEAVAGDIASFAAFQAADAERGERLLREAGFQPE